MNAAAWVTFAVGLTALAGTVVACFRWLYVRVLRPMSLLVEDWVGEPERRGPSGMVVAPARAGVMERLAAIEDGQNANRDGVAELRRELAAAVLRIAAIEQRVDQLAAAQADAA